jgi:hypothetical protein
MRDMNDAKKSLAIIGSVVYPDGSAATCARKVSVFLTDGKAVADAIPVDGRGRFLFQNNELPQGAALHFKAHDHKGEQIGECFGVFREDRVGHVSLAVTHRQLESWKPATRAITGVATKDMTGRVSDCGCAKNKRGTTSATRTLQQRADTVTTVTPYWKAWLYQSLRRLLQSEKVVVPPWINRVVSTLDMLAVLSDQVFGGEPSAADRLADRLTVKLFQIPEHFGGSLSRKRAGRFESLSVQAIGRGGRWPCLFDGGSAVRIVAGGLYVDRISRHLDGSPVARADLTRVANEIVKSGFVGLTNASRLIDDAHSGQIGGPLFEREFYGDGGEPEPFVGGPGGGIVGWHDPPDGPLPGGPGPGGPIDPWPGDPGVRPPGVGHDPCDLLWVDCVDAVTDLATAYRPSNCPRDDDIGSLRPSSVCAGAEDVEIEIHPRPGKSVTRGGPCVVLFRQGVQQTLLDVVGVEGDVVKVKLPEAGRSGCIGFRGGNTSGPTNIGFVISCFKMGRLLDPGIVRLITSDRGQPFIGCHAGNTLYVLPPVQFQSVSAIAIDTGAGSSLNGTEAYLVAEGCRDVRLEWQFGFEGTDNLVDPADFIEVEVRRADGAVVVSNGSNVGNAIVNEDDDETYTVTATAVADTGTCSSTSATIRVDRTHRLRLSSPPRIQLGQTVTMTVTSSCPAPTGGIPVTVSAVPANRLTFSNLVSIPAGSISISFQMTGVGTGCELVAVTVTAPGHIAATEDILVYSAPQIANVSSSPSPIAACAGATLTISGNCFDPDDVSVTVRHDDHGTQTLVSNATTSSITAVIPSSGLLPGNWTLRVVSRGLSSNEVLIQVVASIPEIEAFNAIPVGTFSLPPNPACAQYVAIDWIVHRAGTIRILENGTTIEEHQFADCAQDQTGLFTLLVSQNRTYVLQAIPMGGGSVVSSPPRNVTVTAYRSVKVTNDHPSQRTLVIWRVEGFFANTSDIPYSSEKRTLEHGDETTFDLPVTSGNCTFYQLFAIEKELAENAGRDPEGDAIEVDHLICWREAAVGISGGIEGETVITTCSG